MPWTFAHPAAVLPLLPLCGRRRLSFAALVIGSLSPDFGYYIGRFDLAQFAHTPWGLLLACLPLGLGLLLLLRRLASPVAELMPQPHRHLWLAAAVATEPLGWRWVAISLVSLALGAFTHLFWDAFTHGGRFFVEQIEALRQPVLVLVGREFRVFNLLQHASTLVGLVLLIWVYARSLRRQRPTGAAWELERPRYRRLALLVLAAAACASPLAFHQAWGPDGAINLSLLLVRQVIYMSSFFLLFLAGVALWRRLWRKRCQRL